MFDSQTYPHEYTPDLLDEFIAQLLNDVPDVPPVPVSPLTSISAFATAPVPLSASGPPAVMASPFSSSPVVAVATATNHDAASPYLTCQWVSPHVVPSICGAPLSQDPKHACMHLRQAHQLRGNEKVVVHCYWRDCPVAPMQRGSLVRHVLTVHLGLLRWRCEVCRRTFSRRGTSHTCIEGA